MSAEVDPVRPVPATYTPSPQHPKIQRSDSRRGRQHGHRGYGEDSVDLNAASEEAAVPIEAQTEDPGDHLDLAV